jgi:Ycf66 protein N-terminus
VGFGTPVALLVGIILILVAVGLFFLDRFKPGYKRDSDTVYAVLFLTVGIMSLVNWSQNFLESFQLMIFAGMLIALVIDSIQRRTAQTKQVPVSYRDEERERPSRSYRSTVEERPRTELRVELDDERYAPIDEFSQPRRIRGMGERGNRDPYATRSEASEGYGDSYSDRLTDEPRSSRRSGRRSSSYDDESSYSQDERSRRRPLQLEGDLKGGGNYSDPYTTDSDTSVRRRGTNSGVNSETSSKPSDVSLSEDSFASSTRSRRRRPRSNNGDRPADETYVDYKPIKPSDYPGDDEFDNSNNFDDGPKFN